MPADQIRGRVAELATEINRDYEGKKPLCISILNGSFMFAADLFKHITIPVEISFIKLASYKGTKSTGHVITAIGLDEHIAGRHVIIIEDIIDTGKTLHQFLPQLEAQGPASLKICALLQKPTALQFPVEIGYLGFSIPDKFVLGYGLDYDGLGRNIDGIYRLVEG
ncbi:MAG: hypoxanthine phosphoribosyltransferase [Dinghuibacter sp.]|nr:hypoxanthine phosphoribosyltransferase [Dinghuibacter sp.]